ncbi:MAG: transposase [Bradyrhizobium sp.]|nr:transposase [Bradyrhizobium sp.]
MSTKIHAMVDALGNPTAFFLTAGQAHDLEGADELLPQMQADTLLADKAFDADERVIDKLIAAGKQFVIPPKSIARQFGWEARDDQDGESVSRRGDDRRDDCRAQEFC